MRTYTYLSFCIFFACLPLHAQQADRSESEGLPATVSSKPPADQFFIKKEKEVWEALKHKDKAAATRLLADDFVGMYDFGFFNKSEWVKQIDDQYTVDNYTIINPKVLHPSPATALLLYTSTCKGTGAWADYCSNTSRISDLWVERKGEWLALFSQDTTAVKNVQAVQEKAVPKQSNSASDDTKELLRVENELLNAYVHRDLSVRDRYVADDFVGVDGDGNIYSKQQDMEELKDGTFTLKSFKEEDLKVQLLGGSAIVTGRNTGTSVYKGQEQSWTIRFVDTFLDRDGRWQMVYSQDTNLAESEIKLSAQALAKGREILETLKHNDWPAFSNLLADDAVAIDEDGIVSKKELLDGIKTAGTVFSDYKMENVKVIPQGNGAIVAYRETLVGTQNGKPFTWHIYTHSHWERRGGKWLMTMFQDSTAKD